MIKLKNDIKVSILSELPFPIRFGIFTTLYRFTLLC
jgi:hypothetical protein